MIPKDRLYCRKHVFFRSCSKWICACHLVFKVCVLRSILLWWMGAMGGVMLSKFLSFHLCPLHFLGVTSSRCQLWFRFAAAAALLVVPILLGSVVTDENQDASWEKAGIYRIIQWYIEKVEFWIADPSFWNINLLTFASGTEELGISKFLHLCNPWTF